MVYCLNCRMNREILQKYFLPHFLFSNKDLLIILILIIVVILLLIITLLIIKLKNVKRVKIDREILLRKIFNEKNIDREEEELIKKMSRLSNCDELLIISQSAMFEVGVDEIIKTEIEVDKELNEKIGGLRKKLGFTKHLSSTYLKSSRQFKTGSKVKIYLNKENFKDGSIKKIDELDWRIEIKDIETIKKSGKQNFEVEVIRQDDGIYNMILPVKECNISLNTIVFPHTLKLERKQIREYRRFKFETEVIIVPLFTSENYREVEYMGKVGEWAEGYVYKSVTKDISGGGISLSIKEEIPEAEYYAVKIYFEKDKLPFIIAKIKQRVDLEDESILRMEFYNIQPGIQDRIIKQMMEYER
ncbi:MAG: PilZ domain-containing protein [Candidatus Hydrogenedentota bacterium]